MEQPSGARTGLEPASPRTIAEALVHEYSHRYIASSPHRMKQLLAAYLTSTQAGAIEDSLDDPG
jgi:hypothetical protein